MTFNSCSDFLEIESLNDIVLEKFWNEESDVENVLTGCYSAMQSDAVISRMMAWGEFRSDNVVAGIKTEDDNNLVNILKENITANNSYATWGDFYDVINRCNTIIYYAPQVAERDPNYTQSELQATCAEASAIRDLCYFYLIRAFQDVPYTTEPYLDDTQDMTLPATPFNEILDSLINDLESVQQYAVKKYPETNSYSQYGRITQNAIHAMLCEMYLWKQDYTNAVRYADMVIDYMTADYQSYIDKGGSSLSSSSGMINGFPLISEQQFSGNYYGNAFNDIFVDGCSRESIFELVYMDDDTYLANTAVSRYYGNATSYPGTVKPSDNVSQDVSNELYNIFRDKFDLRYYENVNEVSSSISGIGKYTTAYSTYITSSSQKVTSNFTISDLYAQDMCRSNWILYRLTDVMLLKAEALVQQVTGTDEGGLTTSDSELLQEALDIVNAIEKRSSCSSTYTDYELGDYSSKSMMEELVLNERRRELMFEGKRWFDLVRHAMRGNSNYLTAAVGTKGITSSKFANMNAMFWPIHVDELKVNSNLTQNPAYSSSAD